MTASEQAARRRAASADGFSLDRLGQQHVESVGSDASDAIGLAGVGAEGRPDPSGVAIGLLARRQGQAQDDDAGRPAVASDAGILLAEGGIPVGTGIEGDGRTRPGLGIAAGVLGGRTAATLRAIEEGLDVPLGPLVVVSAGRAKRGRLAVRLFESGGGAARVGQRGRARAVSLGRVPACVPGRESAGAP